jgi:hypothetical protein
MYRFTATVCILLVSLIHAYCPADEFTTFLEKTPIDKLGNGTIDRDWYKTERFEGKLRESYPVDVLSKVDVELTAINVDDLGVKLTIDGKLTLPDTSGPGSFAARHAYWTQGLTIAIAKEADTPLGDQWNDEAVAIRDCGVARGGSFRAIFDIGKLDFKANPKPKHHFAIAIGQQIEHPNRSYIRWTSRDQTLSMKSTIVELPMPDGWNNIQNRLNNTTDLMVGSETYPAIPFMLAINALQSLDKQTAVAELQKYLERYRRDPDRRFDNVPHIINVIQILFEPVEGRRRPWIGLRVIQDREIDDPKIAAMWPLNPYTVTDNILFKFQGVGDSSYSGMSSEAEEYLEDAIEHCELRKSPLLPTTDPVASATKLCDSQQVQLFDDQSRPVVMDQIRKQAILMLPIELRPDIGPYENVSDEVWNKLRDDVHQANVQWDPSCGFIAKPPTQ